MYLIRLLTLLLISFFIISCTNNKNQLQFKEIKYSLAYIGGEYDGLLLKNYLTNHLKSLNIYDENSNLEIRTQIKHSNKIYVTNTDNTSEREKISSNLVVNIYNKDDQCKIFEKNYAVSQFYIFASNNYFISNQKAVKNLKESNTENLVKKFINQLDKIDLVCKYESS